MKWAAWAIVLGFCAAIQTGLVFGANQAQVGDIAEAHRLGLLFYPWKQERLISRESVAIRTADGVVFNIKVENIRRNHNETKANAKQVFPTLSEPGYVPYHIEFRTGLKRVLPGVSSGNVRQVNPSLKDSDVWAQNLAGAPINAGAHQLGSNVCFNVAGGGLPRVLDRKPQMQMEIVPAVHEDDVLNTNICPNLSVADFPIRAYGFFGLAQRSQQQHQAADTYKKSARADHERPQSPIGHILLGLQVLVGIASIFISSYLGRKAFRDDIYRGVGDRAFTCYIAGSLMLLGVGAMLLLTIGLTVRLIP